MLRDSSSLEKLLMNMRSILIIQQSGLDWSVSRLLSTSCLIPLVVLAASVFAPVPFALAAVVAIASGDLPCLYVDRKRSKRLLQLERQLPEVAGTIGRALRAGHSFPSAVGLVGTEFPEPMAGEFRITFDEINYGVPFNEALLNLAKRVPIGDLR
jgi:tight adherence protein B